MRKKSYLLAAVLLSVGVLSACGGNNSNTQDTAPAGTSTESTGTESASAESSTDGTSTDGSQTAETSGELKPLVIGASPAPHAEILNVAKEVLKEQGYDLQIKEYTDYVQPNTALNDGDLDANYFQHLPYLEQFNKERGTKLVSAASIHYEPFGIYAGKTASLEEVADGATIAVPNDASNEARALLLLEAQGIIKLKDGVGLEATVIDIEEYTKNVKIMEIEAAQLPRSLQDVDIAVINGNYAIEAGLKVSDALAIEDSKSVAATTYGNVVAVQEGRENDAAIQALVEALRSSEVKEFIESRYEGAVVPLF